MSEHGCGPIYGARFASHTKNGFTLIEVLVVVAIIALLAAILIPSLARAREAAKVVSCKANCKQIGTMIAEYQAEFSGYVPVMFNYTSNVDTSAGQDTNTPARTILMSVAFRNYNTGTRKLPKPQFDPEHNWSNSTIAEYEEKIMPEFYVCPFSRGRGPKEKVPIPLPEGFLSQASQCYIIEGRYESYQTWLWTYRRCVPSVDWQPQYSALTWNHFKQNNRDALSNSSNNDLKNKHIRWTDQQAQKLGAACLSEVTVSFCDQGENTNRRSFSGGVNNPDSHRTSFGSGTNAIFADTHVQWVRGKRIGGD